MQRSDVNFGKRSASLWSNRIFTKMFSAYAVSTFGDWFDAIAIQVLIVYRWGVGPFTLALIPVVMALPGLFLGSVAGVMADRFPKVKLMMLCDLLTALMTLAILATPNVYGLIPVLALRAGVGVFLTPAQQSMTRQLVKEDQLLQATSMNGLVQQCSKIAGPLLGAVILAAFTPQVCILLNAAARLFSASVLWTIRYIQDTPASFTKETNRPSVAAQWREGLTYIYRSKTVFHTLLFGFFGLTAILMIDYQFTTLLREIAPDNEALVGWLVSAIGAGAVFVIVLLNRLQRIRYGWGLGGGFVWIGSAIAGLGLLDSGTAVIWIMILGVLIGIGNGMYIVTKNYILQKEMPPELVGRVFGIESTITSIVMIGAPLTGGLLIQVAGAGPIFLWFGLITGVIGIAGIVFAQKLWGQETQLATGNGRFVKGM